MLVLTWSVGDDLVGSLVRREAEGLARRGFRVAVLHPSSAEGELHLGGVSYYSVALTVRERMNVVTSVLTALPDFARVASRLIHEALDPREIAALYSHEWTGGLLGCLMKSCLRRPLVTSLCSVESMRSREAGLLNLSIRGLELLALHHSDLVIARSREVAARAMGEYKVPSDRVRIAEGAEEAVDIVGGYLGR
ncbi:MAG: glycosyltransferase family 4 protein [Candidatus Nezhaarchaeales archaeon]